MWTSGGVDKELPKMVVKLLNEDKDVPLITDEDEKKETDMHSRFFENAEDIGYEDMPRRDNSQEDKALYPIVFQGRVKVCVINAGMGLGKRPSILSS